MHDYIQIVGVGQLGPVLGGPGAQSKLSKLDMVKVEGGVVATGMGQAPAKTKFEVFIPDTQCKFCLLGDATPEPKGPVLKNLK
jgi:hypothetical protein